MKKLLSLAFAACLAFPAMAQATPPPCSQVCCYGELSPTTECSYHSPSYGYQMYSYCYYWWGDGGFCEG